jgi:ABC-type multidrug transport system fused ATPase/permease subunit
MGTLLLIVVANLAALAGPWLVGVAIDRGIPPLLHGGDVVPLAVDVAGFAVAVAVQAVASRAFIYSMGKLGETVVLELRHRLFAHFQRLPVAFHEHYTSGRVISRQVSDVDSISDLFDDGLDALVSAVFSLVLVGAGMLLLDWPLALVVLAGFGPLAWLTIWFRRESSLAYRRSRETIAQVIVHFVETFGGIRAVQAFRRESRNQEIFSGLNNGYATASLRSSRLLAVYSPGITLVANVATGVVLGYGGLRVMDGDIKVGVLATFLLYLGRFFDPLQDLSQFYNSFQSAAASLEKISGVLDEQPSVPEPAAAVLLPARHGQGREVRFEGVRFGYRDSLVLPGLDLSIPAGQTVALVGATGAGKTTIARLLARFYDPAGGPGAAG